MIDTNYTDERDADFVATGGRLAYRDGQDLHWSLLYLPTEAALSWDKPFADLGGVEGCRDKGFVMALGSQHGGYRYVLVKETGRVETRVELSAGARGVRCQVVFDNDPSGEPLKGWVVK